MPHCKHVASACDGAISQVTPRNTPLIVRLGLVLASLWTALTSIPESNQALGAADLGQPVQIVLEVFALRPFLKTPNSSVASSYASRYFSKLKHCPFLWVLAYPCSSRPLLCNKRLVVQLCFANNRHDVAPSPLPAAIHPT